MLGGACSISQLINVLREDPKLEAWQVIADHLLRIAGQSALCKHGVLTPSRQRADNERSWLCWCTPWLTHRAGHTPAPISALSGTAAVWLVIASGVLFAEANICTAATQQARWI